MNLFKSIFSKLEAFTKAPTADRTTDMLQAAQAELDNAGAGVILVPKNDTITTAEQLQAHIDGLEARATTAEASLAEANKKLEAIEDKRLLTEQRATPDNGQGGDTPEGETAEQKEQREKRDAVKQMPHYQRVQKILFN